jgi:hypothetical protein
VKGEGLIVYMVGWLSVVFVWLWVFWVCTVFVCGLVWFFGLGCFLVAVWLWFEGVFVHKCMVLVGCGCGVCWCVLAVAAWGSAEKNYCPNPSLLRAIPTSN